jgi:hypothetical protein
MPLGAGGSGSLHSAAVLPGMFIEATGLWRYAVHSEVLARFHATVTGLNCEMWLVKAVMKGAGPCCWLARRRCDHEGHGVLSCGRLECMPVAACSTE